MKTLLITHPACLQHDPGPLHPENPQRLRTVLQALEGEAFSYLIREQAPRATREQLLRAHSAEYVDHILAVVPANGEHYALDDDTILSSWSGEAALRAAGAVIAAVDEVALGHGHNAFCAVRPPGHHAEPEATSGFCLFSNVAIGALHARAAHAYQRIAVIDFDVHHGNGTEEVLRHHGGFFYASTHQRGIYPFTGENEDGATQDGAMLVNISLPPESGGDSFRAAYDEIILPRLRAFSPDFLLISAGFDGHAADPMADLQLGRADFDWLTRQLAEVARDYCGNRLVSVLEGGYDLAALRSCTQSHLRILMGDD